MPSDKNFNDETRDIVHVDNGLLHAGIQCTIRETAEKIQYKCLRRTYIIQYVREHTSIRMSYLKAKDLIRGGTVRNRAKIGKAIFEEDG